MEDVVDETGSSLLSVVRETRVPYCITENINTEKEVFEFVTESTLGIALGAAWVFEPAFCGRFGGRLLDFMGINLPKYRGGAHYTWQILRGDRQGCSNLQLIHGGLETFHKGEIVKRREYLFPAWVRIPRDYFTAAVPEELAFLDEFLTEVADGKDFDLQCLQETFSTYFPFLFTPRNGFVDWRWNTDEIERFICAFDEPYAGASTFLGDVRVFLKDCRPDYGEGAFHPFQVGLIYRKCGGALYVATRDGAILVGRVSDESGRILLDEVKLGQRFHTPQAALEEAASFGAEYSSIGVHCR